MKTKNFNGYQNIVGKNIQKYREQKGLSQRELADKVALLGVTLYNSDISRIENMPPLGWSGEHPDRVRLRF